ncbi:MAG: crossover junction endodeoxyribonuclease RuvC [Patescibacteria group bacterium]
MPVTRVIGIDPGFGRMGIGVVDIQSGDSVHVWHEVVDTPAGSDFSERLGLIRDELIKTIEKYKPQIAAVESLFFQTNVKTAMQVGMARGVILLVLSDAGLPVVELNPNQVKQGLTGYGNADKRQVQEMVKRLLKLDKIPKLDDASDALAIAMVGGSMYRVSSVHK